MKSKEKFSDVLVNIESFTFRIALSTLFIVLPMAGFSVKSGEKADPAFSMNRNEADKREGLSRIWAIDDGEKIKQEDISNPLTDSPLNPVWDGKCIRLFGARNEMIAFQLILQANDIGANNIEVELKELKNKSYIISNANAKSDDPFDYRGKTIELFKEHYVKVTRRGEPGWFYSPKAKPSDYYIGWVPDPLIPLEAAQGKVGSFSISANKNQGIWVDIWIPREAKNGLYKGTINVLAANKIFRKIPVELQVYNFSLPDESHQRNMFYLEPLDLEGMHGVVNKTDKYWELETKYRQMAHRHRIDIITDVPDLKEMDFYHKKYLTGEMYSNENKYEGPGKDKGNTTFSIGPYGKLPREYGWSEQRWWKGSDEWENWFLKNAPAVERHKYLRPDEPVYWKKGKGGGIDSILLEEKWTHSNPGPGKNIPGFVTVHYTPELKGHVDFWSLPSHEIFPPKTSLTEFKSEIAAGRKWGFYNGYRPSSGSVIIDADAIEFRVQPWIMWKYKSNQYFYWRTTNWGNVDVFVDALNFLGNAKANGDGNMFYPGQDQKYPASDMGLSGPIASVRMKNWRRGAQDYEYLWLLKNAGLEAKADEIANEVIPQALFEADVSKDITWPNHGYGFEKYRKQIAELLENAAKKN
jgi:hypothetical protein